MSERRTPNPSPLGGEGVERRRRSAGEGAGNQTQSFPVSQQKRGLPVFATPDNAQALRRSMTDAERKLWSSLRARRLVGAKFRRQVPIGAYVADFLCHEARLVIEVDGGQHAESARDQRRDRWFNDNGFRVLRFWNNEVLGNLEGVLTVIAAELDGAPPHPARAARGRPSPPRGEGPGEAR
jgi:very-short-patch-repair endonuclease